MNPGRTGKRKNNSEPEKSSPPEDMPNFIGKFKGVGLDSVTLEVKGCDVQLKASGGIINHILGHDLLRKACQVWIVGNDVKWVEEHDYETE